MKLDSIHPRQRISSRSSSRWLVAVASVLCIDAGLVDSASATPPMPEALKNVPQAGLQCGRDDPGQAGMQPGGAYRAPDLNCAIAGKALKTLVMNPATALVDVRSAAEFEAAHIDGALNLVPGQLATKTFLRSKPLILLGSGKAEGELYGACATLKANGFSNVRVLYGGMPAWRGLGKPLVGQDSHIEAVPRLSPSDLWLESHFPANLVLLAAAAELRKALPGTLEIDSASPAALKRALKQYSKKKKKAPLAAVVLVLDHPPSPEAVEALQASIQPIPLLIYSDGTAAFLAQLRQNQAVWAAQARGPKRPKCGS